MLTKVAETKSSSPASSVPLKEPSTFESTVAVMPVVFIFQFVIIIINQIFPVLQKFCEIFEECS